MGWAEVFNSPLLPLSYENGRVEPLIMGEGGWAGVINSPLLLLAFDSSIVEPLIRGGGGGGVGWGD